VVARRRGIGGEPPQRAQLRYVGRALAQRPQDRCGRQRERRPRIGHDRLEPDVGAVQPRRVGRHRDHAGVEARQERDSVLEPGRVHQERAGALGALGLQPAGERADAPLELPVGEGPLLGLAVHEERVRPPVGMGVGAVAEDVDPGGREGGRSR
jgi:hypothetical protein